MRHGVKLCTSQHMAQHLKQYDMHDDMDLQFSTHEGPRHSLQSTAGPARAPGELLQESSPSDFFWAKGIDGTGSNHLGRLLMQVRDELVADQQTQPSSSPMLQTINH